MCIRDRALTMKHDEIYLKNKMRRTADKNKEYLFGATLTVADYIPVSYTHLGCACHAGRGAGVYSV